MLDTLEKWLLRILRFCIGLSFAVLIAAVTIQVVGRILGNSPVWTEELTRFALLYVAAVGAGLSFKSGDLVNVDVFCEAFGDKWSARMRLVSAVLTALMCAVLIAPAWKFVSIGAFQTSPAMGLKMTYVHFSVFALLVVLLLFAVLRILKMATGQVEKQPDRFTGSN